MLYISYATFGDYEKIMEIILTENKHKLNIYNLPPEYCCIKMRDNSIPVWYAKEKPVILHHQVSRQFRR